MNTLKTKTIKLFSILTLSSIGLFSLLEGGLESLRASQATLQASQAQLREAQLTQHQLQAIIAQGHSISLNSLWAH